MGLNTRTAERIVDVARHRGGLLTYAECATDEQRETLFDALVKLRQNDRCRQLNVLLADAQELLDTGTPIEDVRRMLVHRAPGDVRSLMKLLLG